MKKRLVPVLMLVFLAGLAIAADKKSSPPSVRVIRTEGKVEEFLLNPTGVTTERTVTWDKSRNSSGDAPDLEFTSSDGQSLSLELEFDAFETKDNVYEKFIKSLETLTLVDPVLNRPPMVKVVWVPANTALPAFNGVVQSMATKYGLFLPDGTPTRATVTLKMKSASSAAVAKKAQ